MCYLGNKCKKYRLFDMGFSLDLRRLFCGRENDSASARTKWRLFASSISVMLREELGAWTPRTHQHCWMSWIMKSLVGLPAPEFDLKDTAGEVHSLSRYRDRWLLMVFHRHLG